VLAFFIGLKMKWIEPGYSKEKVKKAGKAIINAKINTSEFESAATIFFNWRSAHVFPMQIMLDLLRKNAIRIDKNTVVVQRLKRVPSILVKLDREQSMNLSRMEDIAGCRAVVNNTKSVYRVYKNLKNSRSKNILFRERDYIAEPKESGYRGIHLIYKYNGSKKKFHGLPVELQIRSKVQHSWATAVEVVGTFTKQALKASSGDFRWLEFFKYASVEFTKLEGIEYLEKNGSTDVFEKLDSLVIELEVEKRLDAFNVAVKTLTDSEKNRSSYYFILLLDLKKRVISISKFNKSQLSEATDHYDSEEKKYKEDNTKDLVMVSAKSVKDLKKAYPNYFSDTVEFSKNLAKVYKANKKIQLTV